MYLIIAFFILLIIARIIMLIQGPISNSTPLDNLPVFLVMLFVGLSGVASFFAGIISIIWNKEKAIPVFISMFIGLMILFSVVGEYFVH